MLSLHTPLEKLTGFTSDIIPHLWFYCIQPVCYLNDSNFLSNTRDLPGYYVGIAEHVVPTMYFNILINDTRKIKSRSNVRPITNPSSANMCLGIFGGE